MNDLNRLLNEERRKISKVDDPDPPHLVLYFSPSEVLYARIGGLTASFPPLPNTDVIQMRDAFNWAVKHNALTWEIIDA